MPGLHRIQLRELDPEAYPDGWVDIHERRTFETRLLVQDAATNGYLEYGLVRIERYVEAWSLAGSPRDRAYVGGLDEDLMGFVIDSAEAHYAATRRSQEARKSAGQGPGEGERASALGAGDRDGGTAAAGADGAGTGQGGPDESG